MIDQGAIIWITGVPASGKTTLARGLIELLRSRGRATLWLDSDDLRSVIPVDYGEIGREEFYRALAHVALLGAEGGCIVIVSATASKQHYRDLARHSVARYHEIYLACDPRALRGARDVKGLYAGVDAGELDALPGVNAPYELPTSPALTLDTGDLDHRETLARASAWLERELLCGDDPDDA